MEMEKDKNKQDRIRQNKEKIKSQKKAQETHTYWDTFVQTENQQKQDGKP